MNKSTPGSEKKKKLRIKDHIASKLFHDNTFSTEWQAKFNFPLEITMPRDRKCVVPGRRPACFMNVKLGLSECVKA